MKIRVTLKDPDSMPDAVTDAFATLSAPSGVTAGEWAAIQNARACVAQGEITARWMPYAEYLIVEFDTEANTATVLDAKEFK